MHVCAGGCKPRPDQGWGWGAPWSRESGQHYKKGLLEPAYGEVFLP